MADTATQVLRSCAWRVVVVVVARIKCQGSVMVCRSQMGGRDGKMWDGGLIEKDEMEGDRDKAMKAVT